MTLDVVTGEIVAAPPVARDTFGILGDAVRLADVIENTELVPAPLRGRPDAIAAVVLAGHELGLGPMQSLQTIDLIQGRPALSPEGMRALVLSHGHALIVDATDERATVKCHRREWDPDLWTSHTFTLADAERAKLLGKGNWSTYPRAMLTARATAEACRATFADVIAGLSYTAEEISSFGHVSTPPASGPSAGGSTRSRGRRAQEPATQATAAGPGPSHEPEGPPPAATVPPDGYEELAARLNDLGPADKNAFKAWRTSKKWKWPPEAADILEVMAAQVTLLEAHAAEERDTYNPAPIRRDEPPVGSRLD